MKLRMQSNTAGHKYGDPVDSADLDALEPDAPVPYSATLIAAGHAVPWDQAPDTPRVTRGEASVDAPPADPAAPAEASPTATARPRR